MLKCPNKMQIKRCKSILIHDMSYMQTHAPLNTHACHTCALSCTAGFQLRWSELKTLSFSFLNPHFCPRFCLLPPRF